MLSRCSAIAIALLLTDVAHAAEAPDPPSNPQPDQPIVVTGHGLSAAPALPAYDSVEISRERIGATASGRIEDALSSVAGLIKYFLPLSLNDVP